MQNIEWKPSRPYEDEKISTKKISRVPFRLIRRIFNVKSGKFYSEAHKKVHVATLVALVVSAKSVHYENILLSDEKKQSL